MLDLKRGGISCGYEAVTLATLWLLGGFFLCAVIWSSKKLKVRERFGCWEQRGAARSKPAGRNCWRVPSGGALGGDSEDEVSHLGQTAVLKVGFSPTRAKYDGSCTRQHHVSNLTTEMCLETAWPCWTS